jgi:hypothetical protein
MRLPFAPETTDDPALHILMEGRRLAPISVTHGQHVFALSRADASVRLMSRSAVHTEPWIADDRRLGVMLSGLTWRFGALVVPVPLDHPALDQGWWQPEWHGPTELRRWTDGDAVVPMTGLGLAALGPCLLQVAVAGTVPYPRVVPGSGSLRFRVGAMTG